MSVPGGAPGGRGRPGDGPGRVTVFAAHYPPHVGGVERFTQHLWGRMAAQGWDVLVVTTDAAGETPAPDGLRVVVLPAYGVLDGRVPVPLPTGELRDLWRALLASPPDVVVSNTRLFPTSWLAAALAWRTGRPLLHIEHGSAGVCLGRPAVDAVTTAVDGMAGGWVLRRATRCAGVSAAVVEYLRAERGVRDAILLPNGVQTDGWERSVVDYRARLGLGPADLLVVHAGRLIARKGVRETLAAFASSAGPARARMRLAVAGNGPLEPEVRRAADADARVVALGWLREQALHDLLVAADVVVHPSSYPEGLPSILLEAAAAGAALVATPAGGTTDLVRHGETGLIVPFGDPPRLAEALELLASDDALRERLIRAARRSIRERFDWRVVAATLDQELRALVTTRDLPVATAAAMGFH